MDVRAPVGVAWACGVLAEVGAGVTWADGVLSVVGAGVAVLSSALSAEQALAPTRNAQASIVINNFLYLVLFIDPHLYTVRKIP